jgi:hypothetical protein
VDARGGRGIHRRIDDLQRLHRGLLERQRRDDHAVAALHGAVHTRVRCFGGKQVVDADAESTRQRKQQLEGGLPLADSSRDSVLTETPAGLASSSNVQPRA